LSRLVKQSVIEREKKAMRLSNVLLVNLADNAIDRFVRGLIVGI
jgi:hypothetical protein